MNDFCFPYCQDCCRNFPMREEDYYELERNGDTFYCPLGHGLCITQRSVAIKFQNAERTIDFKNKKVACLVKSVECLRGVQTRHRNRLLRGRCPYCGDSPMNLIKHIKTHHNPSRA